MALRIAFLRLAIAAALMAVAPVSGQAEEIRLTLPEARKASLQMLKNGQPKAALQLADGVLLGVPDDAQGHMLRARALQDLGQTKEARNAAKQAWKLSKTDSDRFFAAMVQAGSHNASGNSAMAQYWLRRAAQIAPEPVMRNAAVQDFRRLRRATPWRVNLGLTFEPSDNLNGAPKGDSTDINGFIVRPGARPLPGFRYGVDADFSYRKALSQTSRLKFGAEFEMTRAQLDSTAKVRDPNARANDFREDSFGVSLNYETRAADARWLATGGVEMTRNLRRGEAFSDVFGVNLLYGRAFSRTITGSARAEWRRETLVQFKDRDLETLELGLAIGRQFKPGRLRFDFWHADTNSDLYMIGKDAAGAQISFAKSRPVKGLLPRFGLSFQNTDYDNAPFPFLSTMTRHDQEWQASIDILLPKADWYGFAPEIGLTFRDRWSNYEIYNSESTDLRLGIKSVF